MRRIQVQRATAVLSALILWGSQGGPVAAQGFAPPPSPPRDAGPPTDAGPRDRRGQESQLLDRLTEVLQRLDRMADRLDREQGPPAGNGPFGPPPHAAGMHAAVPPNAGPWLPPNVVPPQSHLPSVAGLDHPGPHHAWPNSPGLVPQPSRSQSVPVPPPVEPPAPGPGHRYWQPAVPPRSAPFPLQPGQLPQPLAEMLEGRDRQLAEMREMFEKRTREMAEACEQSREMMAEMGRQLTETREHVAKTLQGMGALKERIEETRQAMGMFQERAVEGQRRFDEISDRLNMLEREIDRLHGELRERHEDDDDDDGEEEDDD